MPYKDEQCIKYFSVPNFLTFEETKRFCSTQGSNKNPATLVMVKSAELQDFLADMTRTTFDSLWLGAMYDNTSKAFKWVDGELLKYSNWQEGYPQNVSNTQTCIELRPNNGKLSTTVNGKWANVACQKRNMVTCQKALKWSLEEAVNELLSIRRQHQEDVDAMREEASSIQRQHQEDVRAINTELVKAVDERNALREEVALANSSWVNLYRIL